MKEIFSTNAMLCRTLDGLVYYQYEVARYSESRRIADDQDVAWKAIASAAREASKKLGESEAIFGGWDLCRVQDIDAVPWPTRIARYKNGRMVSDVIEVCGVAKNRSRAQRRRFAA